VAGFMLPVSLYNCLDGLSTDRGDKTVGHCMVARRRSPDRRRSQCRRCRRHPVMRNAAYCFSAHARASSGIFGT
jgi:hypothetical protein